MNDVSFEVIEHNGVRYAEVIWASSRLNHTKFLSPAGSSMQFGLLAHEAGFVEAPHYHKTVERQIRDLQQMFVVQRGKIMVEFFDDQGGKFREVIVSTGDAILLCNGVHSIRVLEDMQCVSVKQGPFMGAENDKIEIGVKS